MKRQEKFEVWETKIQNVFQRDIECFHTLLDEILYMSEMLTDKTYDYVKHSLDILCQNDPTVKLVFSDCESMLNHIRRHYRTVNTSQVIKNKLDTLAQGEHNY